ncbi:TPA_asm: plasmid transfer protein, partial [Salmonella enterica subsp. enterica serovar Typhi str. CT18]|nr:plasmid transfer protein [Salmonella enterica subsp. enterica serovar Typhi str. CT18]
KPLNYNLPVTQMDCVSTGLFLLGFLTLKMPWVSSESIITALRLSESKSGQ